MLKVGSTSRAGFTLVEVLVSLTILGILASGVLTAFAAIGNHIQDLTSVEQTAAKAQGTVDTLISRLGNHEELAFSTDTQIFDLTDLGNPRNMGSTFDPALLLIPQYMLKKVMDPADPNNPAKLLGYAIEVRIYETNERYVSMRAFADRRGAKWGVG